MPARDGIQGSNGRTPRDELNRVSLLRELKKLGLQEPAEKAFWWWPSLEDTCLALMDHLGTRLKDQAGRPLAISAIADAMSEFARASAQRKSTEVCVQRFLSRLLDVSHILMSHIVFAEDQHGRQHVWRPFADRYDDWCDRLGGLEVRWNPKSFLFEDEICAARRMLATATMDMQDFTLAFKDVAGEQ